MCERISDCMEMLGEEVEVSKRELGLGLLFCFLLGIILGIMFSPKKRVTIGSYNGNGYSGEGCCDEDYDCECECCEEM